MNDKVLELTEGNFEAEVLKSEQPVLVDFWASWCAPCRMLAPTIDALAEELDGRLKVGKLNVDDHPEVSDRYGIRSIPTLLVFRGGQVVEQRIGVLGRAELVRVLEPHFEGVQAG